MRTNASRDVHCFAVGAHLSFRARLAASHKSRRDDARIAQRFSVGSRMATDAPVPKGRLTCAPQKVNGDSNSEFNSAVPSGLHLTGDLAPNAEALGYSRVIPSGLHHLRPTVLKNEMRPRWLRLAGF